MALKSKLDRLEKHRREQEIEASRWFVTDDEMQRILDLLKEQGDKEKYPIFGYPCLENWHLLSDETKREVMLERDRFFSRRQK